jgi:hypothetical protein
MAEDLFYYLLAINLAAGFFLLCGIIATELRSRRERREREIARAACSELIRLQDQKSTASCGAVELKAYEFPQAFQQDTLDFIKRLQTELNQRVLELEKEL